jgi:phage gpG-like protein
MTSVKIDVKWDGAKIKLITDIMPDETMLHLAGEYLANVMDTFHEEGPGWEQLSPRRIAERGNAHPILVDTGELIRSIKITKEDNTTYNVGTDNPKALVHEFGDPVNHIPERSMFKKTIDKNEKRYLEVATDKAKIILNE